ncbi:hypothetical protein BT67DRAFT_371405 [Trichocladium antarcticum]|uniref:Extracellular membrane protein CFEM domain-containing protein n=1 Tax=Trichocladium antarcticum TaxID=1450529 RepID=A0AAN6ZGB6_9PEZI|nr:hypothetical protein BT67DRAFT_371405 [Trichocladium antarcticum]
MILRRMPYRLTILCLAIWTILPAVAALGTIGITDEILNFVPPCAQECFKSVISTTFDSRICGNSPSLQCLCRQRGADGYTIGEGAVSCIAGESRFGTCTGRDGTAYNMCVGVSRAESKTHTVIVATLLLPASGTGPLLVPTATETGTSTIATKSAVTTTQAPTDSATTSSASSAATVAPTATPPPSSTENPAASTEPSGRPNLSSAQIAGIALGCVAVLALGIMLVVLARCVRRKRLGDAESGFSQMRDSMSFGQKSRPDSAHGLQISSPLARIPAAARDPTDVRWQGSLPSSQQGSGGFGLAIAPFGAGPGAKPSPAHIRARAAQTPAPAPAPTAVPIQRSLPGIVLSSPPKHQTLVERSPPKPTLTLAIPTSSEPVARVPASGGESVVTEFAEDGEGDIAPGTAIWRPPPRDPQSAATYYFADKGGNWVLRNSSSARKTDTGTSTRPPAPIGTVIQEAPPAPLEVELPSPDHKTRAERARDVYGGFSPDAMISPLRLVGKPGNKTKLGSPIAFRDQRREPRLSRPDPAARLSLTAETIGREPMAANNQRLDTHFAMIREARDLTGGKVKRRSTRKARRRVSEESATSIESAAATPFEDEDIVEDEPQVDLSPVAESPRSRISPRRSPDAYPRMDKHDGGQRPTAPGRASHFDLLPRAHMYNIWHPPGRSSPMGESMLPKPRTVASLGPQPNGPKRLLSAPNRRQQQTGSPAFRPMSGRVPMSPAGQEYWQHQRQGPGPASYWNRPQNHPQNHPHNHPQNHPQNPLARARPSAPTSPYELPGESLPSRRYQTPPPQRRLTQTRPMQFPAPQPRTSQHSAPAPTSRVLAGGAAGQGSLLAKRRGADKIAALSLGSGRGRGRGGANADANNAAARSWARHDSLVGPAPITPGWVPELTPTRRGEHLYLNVR